MLGEDELQLFGSRLDFSLLFQLDLFTCYLVARLQKQRQVSRSILCTVLIKWPSNEHGRPSVRSTVRLLSSAEWRLILSNAREASRRRTVGRAVRASCKTFNAKVSRIIEERMHAVIGPPSKDHAAVSTVRWGERLMRRLLDEATAR